MNGPERILWEASLAVKQSSGLYKFSNWLGTRHGLQFNDYDTLYRWSIEHSEAFWEAVLNYFQIEYSGNYHHVCDGEMMPFTRWFEGISLNYAEHIFRNSNSHSPALMAWSEGNPVKEISWSELERDARHFQRFLNQLGLNIGDRVVAFTGNLPESSTAMLATVSSGLVWSSCSPDFGVGSARDRFVQVEPGVLVASTAYSYGGKLFDKRPQVIELFHSLPSLKALVWIETYGIEAPDGERYFKWHKLMRLTFERLEFVRVPFDHPIWILYSSGTTGLPKAIVHGHGGMLLEHLKYLSLHNDVRPGERFFWYSTTGWMMWNFVHASLLVGATAILYDGSAAYPDLKHLWYMTENMAINHFGTSAPFLVACMKEGLQPGIEFNLSKLRSIGSTGSPLPPEAFEWVYKSIHQEVWLCSMSGGTDVCTAFVGSCIFRPVYVGQIQCRALGVAMEAWDENGHAVVESLGEMVITKPMPCMPVKFWNDVDYKKYLSSYFEFYPGVWRHGDWIEITAEDGIVIHGRSDATLNRQGVRMGTAEIYNALNEIPELKDALIINIEYPNGDHFMPLFIQLKSEVGELDPLFDRIRKQLRVHCSPRHVPDQIFVVPDIPYTISGKKMEGPVKKVLMNVEISKAYNPDAMRNPECMQFYIQHSAKFAGKQPST